jgi:hypothetical protein
MPNIHNTHWPTYQARCRKAVPMFVVYLYLTFKNDK